MKRCTRCLLPSTYPGISFNDEGLCSICQKTPSIGELKANQKKLGQSINSLLSEVRGKDSYDCIVAYSGGKDSTYTLMNLVNTHGLNCLAITIDNGFLAEKTIENCHTVTEKLGVDFSLFKPSPDFMNNMYRASLEEKDIHSKSAIKRASAVCNSCINLINNYMIKTALEKNVPIIAGGYIGGQVPKDAAILNIDLLVQQKTKTMALTKYEKAFGLGARRFFDLNKRLIDLYTYDQLFVINPMLALDKSEKEIIQEIGKLGWERPMNTGKNSSNCLLNDLGIALHYKKHKFNPYIAEIAEQLRYGLITKEEALDKAESIPELVDLSEQADKLGIQINK